MKRCVWSSERSLDLFIVSEKWKTLQVNKILGLISSFSIPKQKNKHNIHVTKK